MLPAELSHAFLPYGPGLSCHSMHEWGPDPTGPLPRALYQQLTLKAAGPKEALALQQSASARIPAPGLAPVSARPGEKGCTAVAAAACGLAKSGAELALLAGTSGAELLADVGEPSETKVGAGSLVAGSPCWELCLGVHA